jgi:hypothetical protein
MPEEWVCADCVLYRLSIDSSLALTEYGQPIASSRSRELQHLPFLRDAGIDVTVLPLLEDGYLEHRYPGQASGLGFLGIRYLRHLAPALRSWRFGGVCVWKEMLPWVPGFLERGLLLGVPYVLDYDDATSHAQAILGRTMGKRSIALFGVLRRWPPVIVALANALARRAPVRSKACRPSEH